MTHVRRTVACAWPVEAAFAYMADLSHIVEWDPSVVSASREDGGEDPVGPGSAFRLTVRVGRRLVPMRYVVTELGPGHVTFAARTGTLVSVDTVSVTGSSGRTEVRYEAELRPRGVLRPAAPLLSLAFRRLAARAIRGLGQRLSEEPPRVRQEDGRPRG